MRNITSQFGENAGKVWQVIANKGEVTLEQLKNDTDLSENELFTAVGWLARENKIKKEYDKYKLDTTNLDQIIGTTAGKVYKILDIWEQADIKTMKRLSAQSEQDIYSAVGWLAREDKIIINKDQQFALKNE